MFNTNGSFHQQLTPTLLDTVLPGYSGVSHVLWQFLGIDITLLVSMSFVVLAFLKSIDILRLQLYSIVLRFGFSSIKIDSDVDAYFWLMEWLETRKVWKDSRTLMAMPAGYSRIATETFDVGEDFDRPINYSSSRLERAMQTYEPSLESPLFFWYKGTLCMWIRARRRRTVNSNSDDVLTSIIEGELACFGRSVLPLQSLIREASVEYLEKQRTTTIIRRPAPRKQRQEGSSVWVRAASRPSRSLDTIVMDKNRKNELVGDLHQYLQPATTRWYAERGIPYRRGYLLHGPPGTGKSSISFALAGLFGLDVYILPLQEPSITEEDLTVLFEKLPRQCVVVLEDIDAAGVSMRKSGVNSANEESAWQNRTTSSNSNISLSGLLSLIDGLGSHEGRVLIMTTNHIENLDHALLRPGRIDVKVEFGLATRGMAEDLFMQIYSIPDRKALTQSYAGGELEKNEQASILEMATDFGRQLPNKTLSPAEIQGYLLNYKGKPADALANMQDWICSMKSKRLSDLLVDDV